MPFNIETKDEEEEVEERNTQEISLVLIRFLPCNWRSDDIGVFLLAKECDFLLTKDVLQTYPTLSYPCCSVWPSTICQKVYVQIDFMKNNANNGLPSAILALFITFHSRYCESSGNGHEEIYIRACTMLYFQYFLQEWFFIYVSDTLFSK